MLITKNAATLTVAGPTLAVDAAEAAIGAIPQINFWLASDPNALQTGASADRATLWTDWMKGRNAVPKFPDYPPVSQPAGVGGQQALFFGTGNAAQNGQMVMPSGPETYPAGKSYTFAIAFKSTSTSAGYLIASGSDAGDNNAGVLLNSDGSLRVFHAGGSALAITSGVNCADGNPHFAVVSYDFAAKEVAVRVDGVQRALATGVSVEVADTTDNKRMVIAGRGATQSLTTWKGATAIAEILGFTRALHRAADAANLATLEARRARYGIA